MFENMCRGARIFLMTGGLAAPLVLADGADIEAGRNQFLRCSACHTMSADAPALVGPHLEGIVGRPVAAVAGHEYTAAIRALNFVWTEEKLDEWLQRPQALVPGMCMPFMGLSSAKARRDLIAYLKNP